MNTPEPCDTCIFCSYNCMEKNDENASAWCKRKLDKYWGDKNCPIYEDYRKIKSVKDFLIKFEEFFKTQPKHIRRGQALMNFLFEYDVDEYKKITSVNYYDWKKNIDCFYNDNLINNTLKHLQEHWDKNKEK